jgi:ABC transporter substrate binding protein
LRQGLNRPRRPTAWESRQLDHQRLPLELLKEILPAATQIAVFVNPDDPNAPSQIRSAEASARSLKVQLHLVNVRGVGDLKGAFDTAVRVRAAAVLRMVDPSGAALRVETAALAVRHRLPTMHAFREDVDVGGLAAYGASLPAQYRQAASLVHKLLHGAKPGDLPVEQPTKFDFVINLKTAKALGLTIPPALLARADQIILAACWLRSRTPPGTVGGQHRHAWQALHSRIDQGRPHPASRAGWGRVRHARTTYQEAPAVGGWHPGAGTRATHARCSHRYWSS